MALFVPSTLTTATWHKAGIRLLAKAIAEFAHEGLFDPEETGHGEYRLPLSDGVEYLFRARRGAYESWHVEPGSVRRVSGDEIVVADDPLRFVLDARETLGLAGDTAGHLVRELSATLVADTGLLADGALSSADLADLPYAELEGHQTGHPWLVPNKGRVGFSASDAARYAPEARTPLRLPWMAVHTDIAEYRGLPDLSAGRLFSEELDDATRLRFTAALGNRGLDPSRYLWLPVHPWQWDEIVVTTFAPDVATNRIVPLGEGCDNYLAQQSIRTFSNVDSPLRRHVKLPLSVFNTLVWRGLPTERTLAAPAVTAWVLGLHANDPYLCEETDVVLLGEVASVTVRHRLLEDIPGVPYQYQELLGAIWRESLLGKLMPGEKARTLASLLHVDHADRPFVAELIKRSTLDARAWLARMFHAILPPLLHFLYRYGVVFSAHGENAILVFDEDELPVRLAIKDFVDDVNVCAERPDQRPFPELADMPPEVDEVLLREPPEILRHHIVTALFVGHFRYLAELFQRYFGVVEAEFWAMVRAEIIAYHHRFPELADRFALFDLLGPDVERFGLNRNRLLVDGYRDRPERPHAARHGRVANPLYGA